MDWQKLADTLNALRVIPRIMLITYTLVWYQVINWFMSLPSPSMEQAGLVSVVTGAGAAWFGLYIGGKK
jgi:hypothetical protein